MNIEIFELTPDKAKTIVAPSGYVIMLGWWSDGGYRQEMSWRSGSVYGSVITGDSIPAYCIVPEPIVVNPREYIPKYDGAVGVDHRLDIGSFGKNMIGMLDVRQGNYTQNYVSQFKPVGEWFPQFSAVSNTEYDAAMRSRRDPWTYGTWFRADSLPGHVGDFRYGCRWWQAGFEQIKQTGIDAAIAYNRADNKATNAQAVSNIVSFLTLNPYGIAANIASQSDNGALQDVAKVYSYVNAANNISNLAANASGVLNSFDASTISNNLPATVYDSASEAIVDENFFDDSFFTAGGTIGDNSDLFTPPIVEYFNMGDSASSFAGDFVPDDSYAPQDAMGGYEQNDYYQDDAFASTQNSYASDAQGSNLYADDTYDESVKQGSPSMNISAGAASGLVKTGLQITGANTPAQRPQGVSPIANQRTSVTGGILSGSGSIKQTIGDFLEGSTKLGQAYQNVRTSLSKQKAVRARSNNGVVKGATQDRNVVSLFSRPDGSSNWLLMGSLIVGGYFIVRKLK
jgi:hypothetical protein